MVGFSIEICFPVSRSKNYKEVLKNARLFNGFSTDPNILSITDIDELFGRWENFAIVLHYSTKWTGTVVYFQKKAILPYTHRLFYFLQEIKYCYKGFQTAVDKTGYCSGNNWGCQKLNFFEKRLPGYGNKWYRIGKFEDNSWVVDKEKLKTIMQEEAKMKILPCCPVFNFERVESKINELPDTIKLDENWEVDFEAVVTHTGIVQIPVSINYVQRHLGQMHENENINLPFSDDENPESKPKVNGNLNENQWADQMIDDYLNKKQKKMPPHWEDEPF